MVSVQRATIESESKLKFGTVFQRAENKLHMVDTFGPFGGRALCPSRNLQQKEGTKWNQTS